MEEFLFNYNIFYIIVFTLTLFYSVYLERAKVNQGNIVFDSTISLLVIIVCVFGIGLRDFSVGTDTENYLRDFYLLSQSSNLNGALEFIRGGGDPLFTIITFYSSKIGDERFYLLILAFLFILPFTIFIFKQTNNKKLLLLLAFLSVYSFKWMAVNTVRSGIALGFGLLFLHSFFLKEKKKYILYGIIAVSFHISSIIVILASICVRYFKNRYFWLVVFFLSTVISFLGYGVQSIPYFSQIERASSYIEGDKDYQTGFLFSYWLYNNLIVGYSVIFSKRIKDNFYDYLINLFLILSSIYFLWFHVPFSDRIGVFSWALIPMLITYPFLNYKIIGRIQYFLLILILMCFQLLAVFYLNR